VFGPEWKASLPPIITCDPNPNKIGLSRGPRVLRNLGLDEFNGLMRPLDIVDTWAVAFRQAAVSNSQPWHRID